jgi:hypothetical protein
MKKILFLFTAVLLFTTSFAASLPVSHPVKKVKATEVMIPIGKTGKTISLFDLSQIKVKEMEVLTGKKMKFWDRLAFKAAQKQLRSSINKDYTIDNRRLNKLAAKAPDGSGFHLGGFALGFLLGLIGVLIAYLINDDKKSTRVKWAWIGFAAWVVILIIAFVL